MEPDENMKVSEKERRMIESLRRQPEMREQMEAMLEEIEDEQDKVQNADEAEEAMVRRVREMGRLGMSRWANNKARSCGADKPEAGARRETKKKSAG